MLSKHIMLGLLGAAFGGAVAAGTFAFLIVIGVTPRLVAKCHGAAQIIWFEEAIIWGGIFGNIISVFLDIRLPLGQFFLALYGISAGIFVGGIAVSLAEILNTFPIMFRRIRLKTGLAWVVLAMALGKSAGSFYYFIERMTNMN